MRTAPARWKGCSGAGELNIYIYIYIGRYYRLLCPPENKVSNVSVVYIYSWCWLRFTFSSGIVPKSGKLSTSSYHRVGEEMCTDNHHHSRSHNIIIYQLDTPYHVDFPSQTTGLPMIVRRRPPDRRWHHLNQLQQRQPPLPLLLLVLVIIPPTPPGKIIPLALPLPEEPAPAATAISVSHAHFSAADAEFDDDVAEL